MTSTGSAYSIGIGPSIRRAGWGIGDQLISSLSNFLLAILVARTSDLSTFGAFSVAYLGYLMVLGLSRALVGDPLVIFYSIRARTMPHLVGRTASLSLLVGLLGALHFVLLALLPLTRSVILAFAIVVPTLIVQDGLRYVCLARAEPRRAFASDLAWLVSFVTAWFLLKGPNMAAETLVLAWGLGGALGTALAACLLGYRPAKASARAWIQEHGQVIRGLVIDFLATVGIARIGAMVLPAVAGVAVYGQYRIADLALGPLNVLYVSALAVGVPEVQRRDNPSATRAALQVSGLLTSVAIIYGGAVVLAPDTWLEGLFGASWPHAIAVLPLVVAEKTMLATGFGAVVLLRVLRMTDRAAAARAVGSVIAFLLALVGALSWSAQGIAAGYAVGAAIGSIALWAVLIRTPASEDPLR